MDTQEIFVKQYKAYLEEKDKFVDRSFAANKFYMVFSMVLAVCAVSVRIIGDERVFPLVALLSALGMAVCALWWLNQDAYGYLIKLRLHCVIEKLEEQMPAKPHLLEHEEIVRRSKKKSAIFADIQKFVSQLMFIMFFVLLIFNGGAWLLSLRPEI